MAEVAASTAGSKQCVVCVEEIDGVERLHVVGPCNHVGVCRYGQQQTLPSPFVSSITSSRRNHLYVLLICSSTATLVVRLLLTGQTGQRSKLVMCLRAGIHPPTPRLHPDHWIPLPMGMVLA